MAKFKARARTLDMLGRQQIAGIPTAISELFKNAHDAYADNVEIDYYRSDRLFVLRDDGIGMTEQEFCSRWLTIGTESKLYAANSVPESSDSNKKKRPLLGEKGIGRLAIATIGPQVLVLTRAKRYGVLSNLVVAFVNWRLFECPGIDLEDIDVPIRPITGGELPTKEVVAEMVSAFSQNVERLKNKISPEYYSLINTELKQFNVDPQNIDSYLSAPSLRGNGAGTHFIILPSSDLLAADIDGEPTTERATPLTKALLGFANTMTPDHSPPVIRTAFKDHKTEENYDDLIAEGNFFTPQEFLNADHHVSGMFDEFGQFKGTVSVYGETINNHVIPWKGNGTATACGPFKINFATIQGEGRNSTLPPEEWAKMVRKLNRIGGLYIYRDGIRILPYGDTDYDWLDIEYNRTKSASYYYFSHRRIFGVVEIDHQKNAQLSEKAGREGFRENGAYRQLKSILKNFFVQVTADFFRKEGLHSDIFNERKAQLEKTELDRRRREQQVAVKRVKLAEELKNFFENLSANKPQEQALQLTSDISDKIKHACKIKDSAQAATEIIRIEQLARMEIQNLETQYTVMKPRIALSKAMQKDWHDYTSAFADMSSSVFRPTRELIEGIVGDEAVKARIKLDRRLRAETALNELAEKAKLKTKEGSTNAKQQADKVASEVRTIASSCVNDVETELRSIISEFERTDISTLPDGDFVKARDMLESKITKVAEDKSMLLDTIQAQLVAIDFSGTTSTLDQLVGVEQRNVLLEEEAESDLQLAQLGMAVEIINHEFNGTIRSLRSNLRRLQAWADINQDLQGLYRNIRASFDHLDSYLTLFTPLQRRLQRNAVDIRGSEIYSFLDDLFEERFHRHNVKLLQTESFGKMRIKGFPSSFYPVFVNLVDNAVYWLSQQNPTKDRWIKLDASSGEFLISDSGPGIQARDRESIFDMGFTRKPGGRGMGLHISREVLRRVDYDLALADLGKTKGATFVIRPARIKGEDEGADNE